MGTLTGKSNSNEKQTGPFLVVVQKLQELLLLLNGYFTLSEEDLKNAGIYHGGGGREG